MDFTLDTTGRINELAYHRLLTNRLLKIAFFISVALTSLLWLTVVYFYITGAVFGLTVVLTGVSAGLALALVFGTTYFPKQKPPSTSTELVNKTTGAINISHAASFEFIQAAGTITSQTKPTQLAKVVKNVVYSPANQAFLQRLQISTKHFLQALEKTVFPQLTVPDIARRTLQQAIAQEDDYIYPEHLLTALLLHPSLQASIRSLGLTDQDIKFVLWWTQAERVDLQLKQSWWRRENLLSFTGVGLSWASGYTPFVDRFTRLPPGNAWDDILLGHEGKIDELINTLARQRQSNVLLVGDPGTGKIGIIRELARRVTHSNAHQQLNNDRVIYLNLAEIMGLSGTGAGQFSGVTRALNEIERAGNIILVVDGLSSVLGRAGEQVNLTDILSPFLSSKSVRVVAMINTEDYHLRIKTNQELVHFFEVVSIPSLDASSTQKRVALTVSAIEKQTRIYIPYQTVRSVVKDTVSIMPHIPFPERAFDFLEEGIVLAQNEKALVLKPEHIQSIISRKVGIDLGKLEAGEKERLLNLADIIHERLVNQEQAVLALTKALIRARAEVRNVKRPIGTFLFLGPTGVGKTETAKTLAEVYFGSEEHMIRLDMSEFQGTDAVSRLIGSVDNPVGRLTSLISDHPYTVLLLDEFEKASPQVHQLFLQVFDEGRLSDVSGKHFSFLHTIIIATSNSGAEQIRQTVKNGIVPEGFAEDLKEYILSNNLLRPELLNRFDDVVIYSPLTLEHIREIAHLMLNQLNARLDAKHGVQINISKELVDNLVKIGYNPEFGARPMTRAIQDTVEYAVAQMIVKGQINPGQTVNLPPSIFD